MAKNLLLEIGTEELPSSSIVEGIKNLRDLLAENLKKNRLIFEEINCGATPRRITAFVSNLSPRQEDQEKIVMGPPRKIAYGQDGKPTGASLGFARGLNVAVGDLIEVDTERGVYLGFKVFEKGLDSELILPELLKNTILSLGFAKQMTWGDYELKFSRPIRWITALYGPVPVIFKIEKLLSSRVTYISRNLGGNPLEVPVLDSFPQYLDLLEKKAGVILLPGKRREMIMDSVHDLETKTWMDKKKVVLDEGLLDEVVNLVELPGVLAGSFPQEYLYLPKEILIRAIQHHQRYFAVADSSSNDITTTFILVQNGRHDDNSEIISGNERVLRARLSDAKFFYEEDRKSSFQKWIDKLKGVIFYSGLGSLYDKETRLDMLCRDISAMLVQKGTSNQDFNPVNLTRASMLCKCDLVTNLVVEFPELQGLVGREYAREKGEDTQVSQAIFEHYLPRFAGDILPGTITGSILSLADRIDTITGMFLAGNLPSGSEDPFALRRKASGIVLICLEKSFDFDLGKIASISVNAYLDNFKINNMVNSGMEKEKIVSRVLDFIFARYRFNLEKKNKRTDLFEAIMASGCSSILELDLRYNALEEFVSDAANIPKLSEPLTRCKNIIKGKSFSQIKESFLKEEPEARLYKMILEKESRINDLAPARKFRDVLLELGATGEYINTFFDRVLVMDQDEEIRQNRFNLVKKCVDLYYLFADFSRISVNS